MTRRQRILQMRCADSDIRIRKNRLDPGSRCPSAVVKLASEHLIIDPMFVISGQVLGFFFSHKDSARVQIIRYPGASHSVRTCVIVSGTSHLWQIPRCSKVGMWFQ